MISVMSPCRMLSSLYRVVRSGGRSPGPGENYRFGFFRCGRRCPPGFCALQIVFHSAPGPCRPEAGPQHFHGLGLVFVLGFFILAGHDKTGGQMGDAHRRIGGVDALAAGTGGSVNIDLDLSGIDLALPPLPLRAERQRLRPTYESGPGFRLPAPAEPDGCRFHI